MVATAKDLRFNISFLMDVLEKGEDITITHRGKPKAKLTSFDNRETHTKDDSLFGIWSDSDMDVDGRIRQLRKKREF